MLVTRLDLSKLKAYTDHNFIPSIIKEISHISFDETQFLQLSYYKFMKAIMTSLQWKQ
jgi:hypothetical protein